MSIINVGEIMPDFQFQTAFAKEQSWKTVTHDKKTVLIFLRYYGCTLCQLNMHTYAETIQELVNVEASLYIVLQSDPTLVHDELKTEDRVPYTIICDPTQELYHHFEIKPARNKMAMLSTKTLGNVKKAEKLGLKHGVYEGDELQLPAVFVMDEKGVVLYSHYGKNVDDIPSLGEIARIYEH